MANDPTIASKVIKEASDIVKDGIKEYGKTIQKETEEENANQRHEVNDEYATKETETYATRDILNHSTNNLKEVSDTVINRSLDVVKDTTEKLAEANNRTIDYVKDVVNASEQKNLNIKDHYQKELEQKDKTIGKYHEMLQNAAIQVTEFKTKEELRREFSQKIMNHIELTAKYNEKIKNDGNEIGRLKKKLQPHKDALQEIVIEIRILDSHYEKLNDEFDKEVYVIEELMREHKSSGNYTEDLERKKARLERLLSDVLQKESDLLSKERDRLDRKKEMQEELDRLEKLEIAFEYLKNEQTRELFIGTQKIYNFQIGNQTNDNTDMVKAIDAEVCEVSESKKLLR